MCRIEGLETDFPNALFFALCRSQLGDNCSLLLLADLNMTNPIAVADAGWAQRAEKREKDNNSVTGEGRRPELQRRVKERVNDG